MTGKIRELLFKANPKFVPVHILDQAEWRLDIAKQKGVELTVAQLLSPAGIPGMYPRMAGKQEWRNSLIYILRVLPKYFKVEALASLGYEPTEDSGWKIDMTTLKDKLVDAVPEEVKPVEPIQSETIPDWEYEVSVDPSEPTTSKKTRKRANSVQV